MFYSLPSTQLVEVVRRLRTFPSSLHLRVDEREKIPFPFPKTPWRVPMIPMIGYPPLQIMITAVRETLNDADYDFREFPLAGAVERKGGSRELVNNFTTPDLRRVDAAASRIAVRRVRRLLLVETPITELGQIPASVAGSAVLVASTISELVLEKGFELAFSDSYRRGQVRKSVADFVVNWLLAQSVRYFIADILSQLAQEKHP